MTKKLPHRFVALDVETPNGHNDRISAQGLSVIEDGQIVHNDFTLVNPETYFSHFNIQLTGIDSTLVAKAPTFAQVWYHYRDLLENEVLVAHNAAFDLRVLAHCLHDYDLLPAQPATYLCTCRLGRRCYPSLPNHKLNTMCDYLHINLNHHQADSDCQACARLLLDYLKHDFPVNASLRTYDWQAMKTLAG